MLWNAFVKIVTQSLLQFGLIFGLMIAGGALLTFLSRLTNNAFKQFMFPNFGMYAFGWIGVPVHEFCHAFFCRLFLHDVKKVKWFDPSGKGGAHGYVMHEYHPWNPYHRIGQFFIGVGPVLLGPLILALLFYAMVPASRGIFQPAGVTWASALQVGALLVKSIANKATLTSLWFYLFLYLAVCISSQMELSGADLKQAMNGIVPLFLLLALVNGAAFLLKANWHAQALQISFWVMTVGIVIFTLAAILTILNLAICVFFMTFINRCFGRDGVNPFRGA